MDVMLRECRSSQAINTPLQKTPTGLDHHSDGQITKAAPARHPQPVRARLSRRARTQRQRAQHGIVAARNALRTHGKLDNAALRGLLKVWANECDDDVLRREALLIDDEL
ncbi:MAG: hypothetical protein WBM40_06180 [Thiohalocapsa sp.]